MAKPCLNCLKTIKAYNVRYVYYSNKSGYISRENAIDMTTSHLSFYDSSRL